MNIRWSTTLAALGAAIMLILVLVFYVSTDKTVVRQWINTVGFPGLWVGARLFKGAPLTRTTDVLFNLYLVAFTALEGFLVGWCIEIIRKKKGRHSHAYDAPR